MGFGGLVVATDDEGRGSRCLALPFVRPPDGRGEIASVRLMSRCGSCQFRESVRRCPAGLESILSGVTVARSFIWSGYRVAFGVPLVKISGIGVGSFLIPTVSPVSTLIAYRWY